MLISSTRNIKAFLQLLGTSLLATAATALSLYVMFLLIMFLGAFLWLLTMMGYLAGTNDGQKIMENRFCVNESELEDSDKARDRARGYSYSCAKIEIDGKKMSGKRIYSDNVSTFFMTNDAVYQVSPAGKIIFSRNITRFKKDDAKKLEE